MILTLKKLIWFILYFSFGALVALYISFTLPLQVFDHYTNPKHGNS